MNILFIFRKADLYSKKSKYPSITKSFLEKQFKDEFLITYRHCLDKTLFESFLDFDFFNIFFILFSKFDQCLHLLKISKKRFFRTTLYSYLYKSKKIKHVLTIMPNKSCNQAARLYKNHTNIYEIQHGVIGTHHDYYRYKNLNEFPTKFVVWTNYEKKVIQKLNPTFKSEFLINGIPTINKKKKNIVKSSEIVNILFPTQPSIINTFIPTQLIETLALIKDKKYKICVRQHPSIPTKLFKKKFSQIKKDFPSINWSEEKSIIPINDSLLKTDIVITWHSSIVIEAIFLGIPTIALSPDLFENGRRKDSFYNERKKDFFYICKNKNELINIINILFQKIRYKKF